MESPPLLKKVFITESVDDSYKKEMALKCP